MANTIKVLFWLHRSKKNKEGLVPLMLRLSFQNKKVDKATGYYIDPDQWSVDKQKAKGNKGFSALINEWIDSTTAKISNIYRTEAQKDNLYLPSILEALFAKHKNEPTLLKVMQEHNEQLLLRVGKDCSYSTYEKYGFTYNKVKAFIGTSLKKKDILLRDITTKFIMDFDHYLRVHDNNQHNTAVKYCLNLKRILNVAVMQDLLPKNPLNAHKTVYKDTPQIYLSEKEVNAIEQVSLIKPSHLLVRDLFLLQCNTGLAYTDMTSLKLQDVSIDEKGRKWIIKARQKSGIISTIPLLSKTVEIIEKYKNSTKRENCLFPHYSIQKYNQYIGEVGQIAGINKKLSSHVGRRTFGNIGLAKGLSLNVISKILGHANTLITQRIYAITTQNIISKEIEKWE
jgi:integrase